MAKARRLGIIRNLETIIEEESTAEPSPTSSLLESTIADKTCEEQGIFTPPRNQNTSEPDYFSLTPDAKRKSLTPKKTSILLLQTTTPERNLEEGTRRTQNDETEATENAEVQNFTNAKTNRFSNNV